MLMYSFVGLGEEALFRGFVFPAFTDIFFDSVWIGAVTSSAFFSWAHVVGGRQNLGASPLTQRFLMGLLFAWQTHRNQYDLRKSIFAHTWFDIFVDRGDVGARLEFRF
jgi:membrane protease YdiL (CAAX protease family)